MRPRPVVSAALVIGLALGVGACAQDRGAFPTSGSSAAATSGAGTDASTGLPVPSVPDDGASSGAPSSTPSSTSDGGAAGSGEAMTALAAAADIDTASSITVIVNKTRPFDPVDYAAPDLRSVKVAYANPPTMRDEAATEVEKMFADFADETGLAMQSQSAYRSYSSQKSVYAGWVSSLGQDGADQTSARAGYSEHQTGLAIDISAKPAKCTLDQCFADTPQGEWLAANAWKYGFVLRYPDGLTSVTGYEFEPWHYRYIGIEMAADYHSSGATTLEQYFGLPDAPDYLE